jgi:hypothetical protein
MIGGEHDQRLLQTAGGVPGPPENRQAPDPRRRVRLHSQSRRGAGWDPAGGRRAACRSYKWRKRKNGAAGIGARASAWRLPPPAAPGRLRSTRSPLPVLLCRSMRAVVHIESAASIRSAGPKRSCPRTPRSGIPRYFRTVASVDKAVGSERDPIIPDPVGERIRGSEQRRVCGEGEGITGCPPSAKSVPLFASASMCGVCRLPAW